MVVIGSKLGALTLLIGLVAAAVSVGAPAPDWPARASAIEFRVNNNFSLGALTGTSVSWKGYGGDSVCWRLGLSPDLRSTRNEEQGADERESLARGLEIAGQRLRFLASRSRARPYWGLGLLAGVRRLEDSVSFEDEWSGESYWYEENANRYWAGIVATLGAEIVIAQSVVLGGEYSLAAEWSRTRTITQRRTVQDPMLQDTRTTEISYGLVSRGAALTLAILF